jgi:hypothetical protein
MSIISFLLPLVPAAQQPFRSRQQCHRLADRWIGAALC